jgi:uncharacterized coiled-coil protein SlyX
LAEELNREKDNLKKVNEEVTHLRKTCEEQKSQIKALTNQLKNTENEAANLSLKLAEKVVPHSDSQKSQPNNSDHELNNPKVECIGKRVHGEQAAANLIADTYPNGQGVD